jgi:RHS repeat-associated protein
VRAAVIAAVLVCAPTPAAAQFKDSLVQPPRLAAPERGSVRGSLAGIGFTASELSRGAFRLPLPIHTPADRGPLQARVIPSYSPDGGLSEWGMGWTTDLEIRRYRVIGEIDYAHDEFVSPWGRLRQGSDGHFYPSGLAVQVRAGVAAGDWLVTGSDGTQYRFSAGSGVTTSRGTYSWQLTEVVGVLGDRTTLEWIKNASGRPFLDRVTWGGRSAAAQYELAFTYEPIATAFVDHTTGAALDRRIDGVIVAARDPASGGLRERWHYELSYQAAPFGPAFYLATVQRRFASGDVEPATTFRYQLDAERLPAASLEHYTGLDDVLHTLGDSALQPERSASQDIDADGRPDLEHAARLELIQHTDAGWILSALPSVPNAEPKCRPAPSGSNPPRVLARITGDVGEPHVVHAKRRSTAPLTSQLLVCDRLGRALADLVVPDDWQLGPNIRLADIDRDRRPDLVRISRTGIDILHNESDAQGIRFVPMPRFAWMLDGPPSVTWLNDFDGDGNLDVTVRSSTGLQVMFGLGGARWTTSPTLFRFTTLSGQTLGNIGAYQVTFVDANKDGLADVLLTKGISVWLYTNRGGVLQEVQVAGFRNVQSGFGLPVVADLTAGGDTEVAFPTLGTTYVVRLATAATGLLASADDGMGTVARFTYARTTPRAGIEHRISLLDTLTVESSGFDTVSYRYDYGAPVLHSIGKQLVGFARVDKHSPLLTEHVAFLSDDDVAGVVSLSEDTDDRTPGIVRFARRLYEDVRHHGVRWLRPASVEAGYRSSDGSTTLSTTTRHVTYERGFCPTVVTTTFPDGQLMATSTLATVAAIPDELHCLAQSENLFGTHADPARDFTYVAGVDRNEVGQITRATQFGSPTAPLVLQEIMYDADRRIARVSAPGRGTTVPTYDAEGRLTAVTDPLGIITRADAIDPASDALLALHTARPDAPVTAFFEYDGRERLAASWDDVSPTSSTQPLASYGYQDATTTTPGRIDNHTLADAITGITRRAVTLVGADGEPMVAGSWLGDHYALGLSSVIDRTTLTRRQLFVGTVTEAALAEMTSAELRTLGTPLAETTDAGLGYPILTTTTQQAGVVGTVTTVLVLGVTELVTRVHQPGGFTAESAVDAAGRLVRKTDENGVVHRYAYDALGRLVHLATPDGGHTLAFDGFGRPARVTRDGLGAVTYAYDATTGLPVATQRLDASGEVTDTTATTYDAIARPVQLTETAVAEVSHIRYDYDGRLGSTTEPGQLGRLTRVRGDGWERRALFDALGRTYEEHVSLVGWRDVASDKAFRVDGSVARDTLTITDATGATRFSSTQETVLDSLGRVASLTVDGAVLYTLSYDAEGRLARADFTSGESIVFDHDVVTHHRRGYQIEAPSSTGGAHWDVDPRGLISAETYVHGATTTRRDYAYDGRGALLRATTSTDVASYTYTTSGLPDTISDLAGARSVHRVGDTLTVGGVTYRWDPAGRVVTKGDWAFEYGASGQIAHARRPGRQIDFVYDDADQRLLKRVDGVPVRAEVAGGILTADHFIELVTIGGVVAGVLDNGQFTALLTDPRGTPLAGPDGTQGVASPYGMRTSHLGLSEVIDYARLGWDADLDIIRMGVRDYDARLSQFLTVDPLYFEDLEKCQSSPLQCSLYGYAGGNPISFVDPTGLERWWEYLSPWGNPIAQYNWRFVKRVGAAVSGDKPVTTAVREQVGDAAVMASALVPGSGVRSVALGAGLFGGGIALQTDSLTQGAEAAAGYLALAAALRGIGRLAATVREWRAAPAPNPGNAHIWAMRPFARGVAIENALGRNLPGNYPVIDRFINGIATSIKSLDLGAKTYQNITTLTRTVTGYINAVAGFTGRNWARVNIQNADIAGRALELAVPAGGGTAAQQAALQAAVRHGQSVGVTVTIIPF